VQTVWNTFAQPNFFAARPARYGPMWTMHLPSFPPLVVSRDRDPIRRLFTGDPLVRRHGNDLFEPAFGARFRDANPPSRAARSPTWMRVTRMCVNDIESLATSAVVSPSTHRGQPNPRRLIDGWTRSSHTALARRHKPLLPGGAKGQPHIRACACRPSVRRAGFEFARHPHNVTSRSTVWVYLRGCERPGLPAVQATG